MKICPVCKAPNKDSNASCLDCGHFLGGTPSVEDQGYLKSQLDRAARKGSRRKLLLIRWGLWPMRRVSFFSCIFTILPSGILSSGPARCG